MPRPGSRRARIARAPRRPQLRDVHWSRGADRGHAARGRGTMTEHEAPLRLVQSEASSERPPAPAQTTIGLTPPRRRGGSSRFLTEFVVEVGLADAETVNRAVEASRTASIPAERVLLDQHAITSEQLSRAIAERY